MLEHKRDMLVWHVAIVLQQQQQLLLGRIAALVSARCMRPIAIQTDDCLSGHSRP